jgi:DNA-directed RNA polymerase subunit RPC12/RpoP
MVHDVWPPVLAGVVGQTSWTIVGRVVTCAFCGETVEGEEPPVTWTSAVEQGSLRYFCDRCSREHLRAMESKLDSEWW